MPEVHEGEKRQSLLTFTTLNRPLEYGMHASASSPQQHLHACSRHLFFLFENHHMHALATSENQVIQSIAEARLQNHPRTRDTVA
jgi:hypothetical protein